MQTVTVVSLPTKGLSLFIAGVVTIKNAKTKTIITTAHIFIDLQDERFINLQINAAARIDRKMHSIGIQRLVSRLRMPSNGTP